MTKEDLLIYDCKEKQWQYMDSQGNRRPANLNTNRKKN